MAIKPGDKAPNFSLYDTEKQEVSLDDFKGKNVVLLFFPLAFSSVCTAELCQTRDDIASYRSLDAEILATSIDSVYVLRKFREDQNLNFTLLSDFNKEAARAYGTLQEVWNLNMKGVSKRAAFVIDRSGIIRYAEVLDNPGNLPNFEAIKETLSKLNGKEI